jgi:hypothetical protein
LIAVLAAALDLLVSAAFLLGWRFGWIRVDGVQPEGLFLFVVNANMLLCAAAAVASAAVGLRRRVGAGEARTAAGILLVTLALMTGAEALYAAGEAAQPRPSRLESAGLLAWHIARASALVWVLAVVRSRGEGAGWAALDPRRRPAIAWPALGLVLYQATDGIRHRFEALGDPEFYLGELGFFAGYLAVALGAFRATDRDATGRAGT